MVPAQRSLVNLGQRHPPSLVGIDDVGVDGVDIAVRAVAGLPGVEADDAHDASRDCEYSKERYTALGSALCDCVLAVAVMTDDE